MVMFNSFNYPDSAIRYEQRNVRAILDKIDLGSGNLILSESTLCWQNNNENIGFSIGYQNVTLHAISKDESVYPRECLYIMLDGKLSLPGKDVSPDRDEHNDESDDIDTEYDDEVSELIFVPDDENSRSVADIYDAMTVCQALNPDPADIEDEDDENLYADAEDDLENNIVTNGRGDADINAISRGMAENGMNINYVHSENDDDEFQDAD